jgi:hypothetical protein
VKRILHTSRALKAVAITPDVPVGRGFDVANDSRDNCIQAIGYRNVNQRTRSYDEVVFRTCHFILDVLHDTLAACQNPYVHHIGIQGSILIIENKVNPFRFL